jgi:PAS domain-containing protein
MRRVAPGLHAAGLGLAVATVIVAIAAIAQYVLYRQAQHALDSEVKARLLGLAAAASFLVDGDQHLRFREGEENTARYRRAVEPLARFQRLYPDIRYVYTFTERDGKICFLLDPTPPGDHDGDGVDDKSYLWEEYPEATPAMFATLRTGRPQAEPAATPDRWGTFWSAYAPIRDRQGRVRGAVGVDMTMQRYEQELAAARHAFWRGLILSVALAALLGVLVALGWWRYLAIQQRLQASEAYSRSILNALPDLLFVLDTEGIYHHVYANDGLASC